MEYSLVRILLRRRFPKTKYHTAQKVLKSPKIIFLIWFLTIIFVRIEIQCFLKFLWIEVSDRSGGFWAPDCLPDQILRMTEVGCFNWECRFLAVCGPTCPLTMFNQILSNTFHQRGEISSFTPILSGESSRGVKFTLYLRLNFPKGVSDFKNAWSLFGPLRQIW